MSLIIASLLKFRADSYIHISVNVIWNSPSVSFKCLSLLSRCVQLRVYFLSYLWLSYLSHSLGLQYQRWPHFIGVFFNVYIGNDDFLVGHMFVFFDWLLCCIGRLLLVGPLVGKWFAYIALSTLISFSISDSCCCPLANQILSTQPPALPLDHGLLW